MYTLFIFERDLFSYFQGNILPAIFIVITGNVAEDPGVAVAMLTIGVAMSGCQYGSGFIVNPVDIAPRYAGIILAISNTTGSLGGFFAPVAIGIITVNVCILLEPLNIYLKFFEKCSVSMRSLYHNSFYRKQTVHIMQYTNTRVCELLWENR